jgi:hypothetical protein
MARKSEGQQPEMIEEPLQAPVEKEVDEAIVENMDKEIVEETIEESVEEGVEEFVEEFVEEAKEKIYLAKISFSYGGKIHPQGTIVKFSEELLKELLSKKVIYLKE